MRKILFVCLGNICRSPLAEGICLHLIKENNLKNIIVDSAGTANYHVNENPDKRTIANAKQHNVDLSQLKARQFNKSDFNLFNEIYVMDNSNYRNVINLASNNIEKEKVKLLLKIDEFEYEEVPDPYYGNEKDFEKVFQLVYNASTILLGIK